MATIKGTVRVPTKIQYAFIEAVVEGTPEQIVEVYNELNEAYWKQGEKKERVPVKDFNSFLDAQIIGVPNHVEQMEGMSETQLLVISEVRKALKRIGTQI